uniref:Uncharacterized protein n=1 Tax=Cereibacter sphaeroides (strain ATCC 17025 / ATH 2.4.3) TaxID=349102 RepID=A4WZX4_CERS5
MRGPQRHRERDACHGEVKGGVEGHDPLSWLEAATLRPACRNYDSLGRVLQQKYPVSQSCFNGRGESPASPEGRESPGSGFFSGLRKIALWPRRAGDAWKTGRTAAAPQGPVAESAPEGPGRVGAARICSAASRSARDRTRRSRQRPCGSDRRPRRCSRRTSGRSGARGRAAARSPVDHPQKLAQRHLRRFLDQQIAARVSAGAGDVARIADVEQDMLEKPLRRARALRDILDP